jgi:hypothetical protein
MPLFINIDSTIKNKMIEKTVNQMKQTMYEQGDKPKKYIYCGYITTRRRFATTRLALSERAAAYTNFGCTMSQTTAHKANFTSHPEWLPPNMNLPRPQPHRFGSSLSCEQADRYD